VIDCKRRLQKGAAGKRDQPDAIALQLRDQILRRQLHPLNPVGSNIVRERAARGVGSEKQIEPTAFYVFVDVTPARFGEGGNRKRERKQDQTESNRASGAIDVPGELRQQTRGNKFAQLDCAPPLPLDV